MYFKRNEPFRFTFTEPLVGKLYYSSNGTVTLVKVSILDVSKNGAKVYSIDKIKLESGTQIKLSFEIDATSFDAVGTVNWTKPSKTSYEMGLHLDTDDTYQTAMVSALKKIKRLNS
ncbi:PilZ domain-containing protein [Virgibacillus flavescens]|uniref:PilZ domain-containing protein n=1 Tax=Virgibacillus flavescens TaxID=1611422 RepID=UPI003D346C64